MSQMQEVSGQQHQPSGSKWRRWLTLPGILILFFMTILQVALVVATMTGWLSGLSLGEGLLGLAIGTLALTLWRLGALANAAERASMRAQLSADERVKHFDRLLSTSNYDMISSLGYTCAFLAMEGASSLAIDLLDPTRLSSFAFKGLVAFFSVVGFHTIFIPLLLMALAAKRKRKKLSQPAS